VSLQTRLLYHLICDVTRSYEVMIINEATDLHQHVVVSSIRIMVYVDATIYKIISTCSVVFLDLTWWRKFPLQRHGTVEVGRWLETTCVGSGLHRHVGRYKQTDMYVSTVKHPVKALYLHRGNDIRAQYTHTRTYAH